MNDGEWTFNYSVEFVGLDGDDAVQKALSNNPVANSIIFDENYEGNAGNYDPNSRKITMGRNRRTNFEMRGETLIHEIGHSWGLPHENQMPNSPIFNKENELGVGIMSYGKSRIIQQFEIEHSVNQILNVANTSPKNKVQIHVKGTGYKHQIIK